MFLLNTDFSLPLCLAGGTSFFAPGTRLELGIQPSYDMTGVQPKELSSKGKLCLESLGSIWGIEEKALGRGSTELSPRSVFGLSRSGKRRLKAYCLVNDTV